VAFAEMTGSSLVEDIKNEQMQTEVLDVLLLLKILALLDVFKKTGLLSEVEHTELYNYLYRLCDDSLRLKPRASGMTLVCRPTPTVRFMPMSEQSSKQLMHCMARFLNAVAFLPLALRQGTRRNAIWLQTCKRTVESLAQDRTNVQCFSARPCGAASIPAHECGGFTPRFGKLGEGNGSYALWKRHAPQATEKN
jgi:hypothetical protein